MLLNIVKYLVKMTTAQVKMQMQADVHTHTEQLSWEISLFTHFSCMFAPTKPKYFLWQIFLVSFIFASGISSEFLYNAESEQKRNAPICHYPAQEEEGGNLEEIHNWGLDLNEVSELEAWHVQKLVQHCAARHPSSLLGLLPCAKHKYPLEGSGFYWPGDWIPPTQAQRGVLCRRSSAHLDSWACWPAGSPEMFC